MNLLETLLLNQFTTFMLVLGRVGALVMTAPILSSPAAPIRVRGMLAVALALLVTPLQVAPLTSLSDGEPAHLIELARLLASEALLGLLLGLGVMILLSGAQLAGQIVSQLGGTAVAETFDAAINENASVYSQLFYFLTLVMFLLVDGHRLLVEALLDTYIWLPPGEAALGRSYVGALITLLSQSMTLGIRAAAPAMVALLCATLLLGLVGRTLPQINVLAIGFGVNAMLTLGILFVSIGSIGWAFPDQIASALDLLRAAVRNVAEAPLALHAHG